MAALKTTVNPSWSSRPTQSQTKGFKRPDNLFQTHAIHLAAVPIIFCLSCFHMEYRECSSHYQQTDIKNFKIIVS